MILLKNVTWNVEETQKYYQKLNDTCDCGYCRNFLATIDKFYPALSNFLHQFGLTMNQPVESVHVYRDANEMLYYEAWYGVSGNLKEEFSISMAENLKVTFAPPDWLYKLDFEGDYFWILVDGILLPWELEEEYDG